MNDQTRVAVGITGKIWRKVSREEAEEWLKLHSEGLSARAIGRRFDRDHGVVRSWLAKLGVTPEQIIRNRGYPRGKRGPYKDRGNTYRFQLKHRLYGMLQMARRRAEKRGWRMDITVAYIVELYTKQNGKCALTGRSFDLSPPPVGVRANPYVMSIDRIDNRLGYTRDNIRLVIWAINWAIGEWGETLYRTVALAYLGRENERN